MTYFIILQGLTISFNHSMRSWYVGYTSGLTDNQIPPEVGQDDLFSALEVKLAYIDLIRIFSPMQWNMEVQPTSNYLLEMAL